MNAVDEEDPGCVCVCVCVCVSVYVRASEREGSCDEREVDRESSRECRKPIGRERGRRPVYELNPKP